MMYRGSPRGEFTKRITIKKITDGQDATYGSATQTETVFHKAWAKVETTGGSERQANDQVEAGLTHKITILHKAGIKPKMRIVLNGRELDIVSVINPGEANIETVMECMELVT